MRAALFDFASGHSKELRVLKLERRKLPVEVLIVESGNKILTQN
jgi:hypothetical protein